MLYFDPSEARDNSKLSLRVIKAGQPLIGLETSTGADLLITTFPRLGHTVAQPPGSLLLKQAVKGGFLIQRKSDHDLTHSIKEPGLSHILARMCQHEGAWSWLMCVGEYRKTTNNKLSINGFETGFHYNTYRGNLNSWQIGGGEIQVCDTEEDAADWLLWWNENINKIDFDKEVRPRHDRSHLKIDPRPWRSVLEEFPGLGPTLSSAIADYCGDLKTSLQWMSMLDSLGLHGIGVKTKQIWREFMNLSEDEIMMALDEDDPVVQEVIRAYAEKESKENESSVYSTELSYQESPLLDPVVGG